MRKSSLTLFSLPALALETENYLVWDRELPEVTEDLNTLISDEINSTLDHYNSLSPQTSCEDITFAMASSCHRKH